MGGRAWNSEVCGSSRDVGEHVLGRGRKWESLGPQEVSECLILSGWLELAESFMYRTNCIYSFSH